MKYKHEIANELFVETWEKRLETLVADMERLPAVYDNDYWRAQRELLAFILVDMRMCVHLAGHMEDSVVNAKKYRKVL